MKQARLGQSQQSAKAQLSSTPIDEGSGRSDTISFIRAVAAVHSAARHIESLPCQACFSYGLYDE